MIFPKVARSINCSQCIFLVSNTFSLMGVKHFRVTSLNAVHRVKSVRIRSFPYVAKYGPEKFQIQTLFTHWFVFYYMIL